MVKLSEDWWYEKSPGVGGHEGPCQSFVTLGTGFHHDHALLCDHNHHGIFCAPVIYTDISGAYSGISSKAAISLIGSGVFHSDVTEYQNHICYNHRQCIHYHSFLLHNHQCSHYVGFWFEVWGPFFSPGLTILPQLPPNTLPIIL